MLKKLLMTACLGLVLALFSNPVYAKNHGLPEKTWTPVPLIKPVPQEAISKTFLQISKIKTKDWAFNITTDWEMGKATANFSLEIETSPESPGYCTKFILGIVNTNNSGDSLDMMHELNLRSCENLSATQIDDIEEFIRAVQIWIERENVDAKRRVEQEKSETWNPKEIFKPSCNK